MSSHNRTDATQTQDGASVNPEYAEYWPDWKLCRVANRGQRIVKERTTEYLPPTASMIQDDFGSADPNSKGNIAYASYLRRAVFEENLQQAILTHMGQLWHKQPTIELPTVMEPMRENATRTGETLVQLLRNINNEQLSQGRLGLWAEMSEHASREELPYLVQYDAERIVNWDTGERSQVAQDSLNFVVLDESGNERRTTFNWEYKRSFRVLLLGDALTNEPSGSGFIYTQGTFESESHFAMDETEAPIYRGKTLDFIPFVFINSMDTEPTPMNPPLLALANKDMTIYTGQADYRQALHHQAQELLVISGQGDGNGNDTRVGAGAVLHLSNPGAKAEYVGISSEGIPEMRTALENDSRKAELMAGQMTDNRSNARESGETMKARMAGQTVTLVHIALSGALGLQTALRMVARWIGANEDEVVVTPNLDFGASDLTVDDLVKLQAGKNGGLPLSQESIHAQAVKSGISVKEFDDEIELINSEEPLIDMGGGVDEAAGGGGVADTDGANS